jgi:6-pyruvoyltetrahydropterin/6-carboxytetrahydropterin synthase
MSNEKINSKSCDTGAPAYARTHHYDPKGQEVWVWKKISFNAAHRLPLYEGACFEMHGHTYFVELGVLCTIDPRTGMGIDLKEIGDFLRTNVFALFDHKVVNERLPGDIQPTAEQIGRYILSVAARYFPAAVKVRVYETPDSWVELEDDGSNYDMQVGRPERPTNG